MQKKIRNIQDLKLAKEELKARIELNEAKMRLDIKQIKAHYSKAETYFPSSNIIGEGSDFVTTAVKTLLSNLVIDKLLSSKSDLISRIGKILLRLIIK